MQLELHAPGLLTDDILRPGHDRRTGVHLPAGGWIHPHHKILDLIAPMGFPGEVRPHHQVGSGGGAGSDAARYRYGFDVDELEVDDVAGGQ